MTTENATEKIRVDAYRSVAEQLDDLLATVSTWQQVDPAMVGDGRLHDLISCLRGALEMAGHLINRTRPVCWHATEATGFAEMDGLHKYAIDLMATEPIPLTTVGVASV